MKVRFQADADLNQIIIKATLRREPSIDFQSAQVANLSGLSDRAVLEIATRAGRVLVTHDRKTMPKYFAEFITTERRSGVLIVPQKLSITQIVEELILIQPANWPEALLSAQDWRQPAIDLQLVGVCWPVLTSLIHYPHKPFRYRAQRPAVVRRGQKP